MRVELLYSLISILFITGCATQRTDPLSQGRLEKLRQKSIEKDSVVESQKLSQFIKKEKKVKLASSQGLFELPKDISEDALYTEVLESYQKRHLERLTFMVENFTKKYSKSVYADNAYFLLAQLELALGNPSQALATYDKVLRLYPTGNKYVSALFGKGVAYRKLQLYPFSLRTFQEVKKRFPGSPEFYKVELEEKLVQLEKGT